MEQQWGPRPGGPETAGPSMSNLDKLVAAVGLLSLFLLAYGSTADAPDSDEALTSGLVGTALVLVRLARPIARLRELIAVNRSPSVLASRAADPVATVHKFTDGRAFLGVDPNTRQWVVADHRQAVLVLGPPQSGKTSSIVVPAILSSSAAVVSTSTKAEVLRATADLRARNGRVWLFDPSGAERVPDNVLEVHWSPVRRASTWDGARAMAEAMISATTPASGTGDSAFWDESAKMLLAPLLHAAALTDATIMDVRRWVSRANVDQLNAVVKVLDEKGAQYAADDLNAIVLTDEKQFSGVIASARVALKAYGTESVAMRTRHQAFDVDEFVRSRDTLYITAPALHQTLLAPLIAGLLEELRDSAYRAARTVTDRNAQGPQLLWVLDEVANIAPLKSLPSTVSEAGGQGLQILACLQDLSQARVRWGSAADGFLSLFGTKVVLPGIGDRSTLEALSILVGDWDRPYSSNTVSAGRTTTKRPVRSTSVSTSEGWTYTTQREAQLSPSEIANIPAGSALLVQAGRWAQIALTPYHAAQPWLAVLAKPSGDVAEQVSAEARRADRP